MAQEQLNDYKYIIVPKQFAEFKRENQYQTSTLVKFLFGEKGFDAVYEDELPQELRNNACLGLRAKLVDGSSLFTTKSALKLENCNGEEVFETKEGRSKKKDYKASYGEALREAFTSFDGVGYAYNGKAENSEPITVSMKNDIKKLPNESGTTNSSVNTPDTMVEQQATRENQRYVDRRPVPSDLMKAEPENQMDNDMVEQEAARDQRSYQNQSAETSDMSESSTIDQVSKSDTSKLSSVSEGNNTTKNVESAGSNQSNLANTTLYAQELANGYQLVDSSPKIRIIMEKTSMPDFYLATADDKSGTVFKKNDTWFFEYYSGNDLISEELSIKF